MTTQAHYKKPIKRHKALQPLSRDHHHTLLLVWKIRRGLDNKVEPERIKRYSDWFYQHYIIPHFEYEETWIYPLLDPEGILFITAMEEHDQLRSLFTQPAVSKELLTQLSRKLEAHVRFEERVLFQVIQEKATLNILDQLLEKSEAGFVENEEDCFWMEH